MFFKIINPATGENIKEYPELTHEELNQKLAVACNAFCTLVKNNPT